MKWDAALQAQFDTAIQQRDRLAADLDAAQGERDRERERLQAIHYAVAPGTGGDVVEIVKGRFAELETKLEERRGWTDLQAEQLAAAEATIRDLRAEIAPYQLPADGEPLTLVQIVPALLAGRVLREVVHDGPPPMVRLWRYHDGAFEQRHPLSAAEWAEDYPALDAGAEWYLLPLPTPEPRQLTFAEAWEAAEHGEPRLVAFVPRDKFGITYEIHRLDTGPELIACGDQGERATPRLSSELLAATWTEAPR